MVLKRTAPKRILFNFLNFSLFDYKSGRASSSRAVSLGG